MRKPLIEFNKAFGPLTGQSFFDVEVKMPFRIDLTAWALRRCSDNITDRLVDQDWRRVLIIKDKPVEIVAKQKLIHRYQSVLHVNLDGLH